MLVERPRNTRTSGAESSEPETSGFRGLENNGEQRRDFGETLWSITNRQVLSFFDKTRHSCRVLERNQETENCQSEVLAVRQGFEPWRQFPAYTRSRRAPSTTRPPHQSEAAEYSQEHKSRKGKAHKSFRNFLLLTWASPPYLCQQTERCRNNVFYR